MKAMIRKVKSAFTLIELLVVIAIIAILAAILVPAVQDALLKGKMTGVLSNGRGIYVAAFGKSLDDPTGMDTTSAGSFATNGTASSTAYFNMLITNGALNVKASYFAAPGMVPSPGTNLLQAGNAWNVTCGFSDSTMDGTPYLFTRNLVIAALPGASCSTALTDDGSGLSFATKGLCVVAKGGSAFILKPNMIMSNFTSSATQTNAVAKP